MASPVSPFMRLIYAFFRLLTWAGLSVFYRRRVVLGREHLGFEGPAIVVSNHPSTLMDPLHTGLQIRQEMFFLANYGLFKHPVSNWVFRRLFCIPVKRKEDVAEGEARDNDAAFEASFQHLEKKGVLYIAAEGVSWMNRYVRPFKTGAARIAFGAEHRNNWILGVKIVPVGLSYDAPRLFRSNVTIEYGPAIDPKPWAEAYAQNPEQAVDDFTAAIEQAVRVLTLDSGNEQGDTFVTQLETMAYNAQSRGDKREIFLHLKAFLVKNLQNAAFRTKVEQYFAQLQQASLTDAGIGALQDSASKGVLLAIKQALSFPLAAIGFVFWFLPCYLPYWLCKRLNLYPGYDSNVKMLAGLFTFSLALWGGWKGAFCLSGNAFWAWGCLVLLVLCGYVLEYFLDQNRCWRESRAARAFQKQNPAAGAQLCAQRTDIVNALLTDKQT